MRLSHSARSPSIRDVRFTPASPADVATGLLGWINCTYGSLRLDGLALRRTRTGRFVVTFPTRIDGAGREHHFIRPLDDRARRSIESQVLLALNQAGRLAS